MILRTSCRACIFDDFLNDKMMFFLGLKSLGIVHITKEWPSLSFSTLFCRNSWFLWSVLKKVIILFICLKLFGDLLIYRYWLCFGIAVVLDW